MTFSEKKLYHQIHPVKLATDIAASIVSLYLFWLHFFWIALTIHFLLPVLGSFFVITFTDLEKLKKSSLGKYVRKYMTGRMEVIRLTGDFITVFGAWYHQWLVIVFGLVMIVAAWLSGKLR
ncbi:MAG TPA: hypothetical protein VGT05_00525 [Patescibacteria group bacterium]|nr:hypothetical protein [Patescibacteria group bacterium]